MNNISNKLWGILLIIIGLVFGLNALEITDINIFFDGWWTLFIIIPCFINLFKDEEKLGNLIGIAIGTILLLSCQEILNFEIVFKLLGPIILVLIGLSFIFKDSISNKVKKEIKKLNKNIDKEYYATFGSSNIDLKNEKFEGGSFNATFGSINLDLRKAKLEENTIIKANSIFGGIDIIVPTDVNVKVTSTPIFGGVSNDVKNDTQEKTIYVNATCLFGGVKIK